MAINKITQCYERYRGQIQHEDLLLNQRVTWVVTSQAFLLGSYVFLVNSPTFYAWATTGADPKHVPGCDHVVFDLAGFINSIHLLRSVFQLAGFTSSVATCISSLAAVLAVARLTRDYGRHLVALDRGAEPGDCRDAVQELTDPQITAALGRIHEREGLPALVSSRLHRIMGLLASVFFGLVFAAAWLLLIFPGQHLWNAMPVVLVLLLASLPMLLYKLSDWGSVKVAPARGATSRAFSSAP
jgi:hypothetical protein